MIAETCGNIMTQYNISLFLGFLVCILAIGWLRASTRIEQFENYIKRKEKESDRDSVFRWINE